MIMGKLIVLEGTDGSGKSTQFQKLIEHLEQEQIKFRKLRFPQYDEPSSALIRMYLGGDFGEHPEDVNVYAASTFYAVDRYASYIRDWKKDYEAGTLLISDRYTTSNAIHQGGKLSADDQRAFFSWLSEFEYEKFGLPKPDLVICFDMPIEVTDKLMRKREQATDTHADIHEKDLEYLKKCHATALSAAEHYGWKIVHCVKDGAIRSIEDIHAEVYGYIAELLKEDTK